ncbi:MAG: 30S ribosomal protein S1 [Pirellulales bacterium]|nr:30S ribosomal protein S1 [Pirellulales bacterium]
MVNRNLIRGLDAGAENWDLEITAALGSQDPDTLVAPGGDVAVNKIVKGRILRVGPEFVLVDVGYKSEGTISRREWDVDEDEPTVGESVDVLIEEIEDVAGGGEVHEGMILLSKRKAKKIQEWENVMSSVKEGDVVTGVANRKIKGGLLVDIGVNVFLPASQVDIRRPSDIGEYVGRTIQCKVLKIDEARRNIVVSRRALIEDERAEKKSQLLTELEIGQLRSGVVKNIADFGAFVDLGGLDGLLHITDMSWGRIGHPSEMVSIDQEIEVKVLDIDYKKEKIALGLKQKLPSPWEQAAAKYPQGSTVKGSVVNVMSYGAFVKLEDGIEGLVHISEMSWTRRVNHPNELVSIGDVIEVVVLGINEEKHEISLGMKQTQANPWDKVAERYPPDSLVKGSVRNLTNYGAFVEIEEGIDGLLHVSDMSWTRKISHPSEMLEKGQEIECKVVSVDQDRRRIALGFKQMSEDPWATDIPGKYQQGQIVTGTVTKLTNFGVFVGLENGLEGLLHISELSDEKVETPEDVVKEGDRIEVKVLRVDQNERKIGLSRKRVNWTEEQDVAAAEGSESDGDKAQAPLKGGIGDQSGPLIQTEDSEQTEPATSESSESGGSEESDEVRTEDSTEVSSES